jgi:hypothetical protein
VRPHYVQAAVPALACLAADIVSFRRETGALLLPIGVGSVLSVRSVLLALALGQGAPEAPYGAPYGEKKRVLDELLAKEALLVKEDHFEYLILLEARWRELPKEERERFRLEPREDASYWDLVFSYPRPKRPRSYVVIGREGPHPRLVEVP